MQAPVASPPVAGPAAPTLPDDPMSWRRMDLHVHTPASTDYQQAGVSALDILRKAEERGLDIVAFTDHNSVRGYADLWREIEDLELLEYLQRLTAAEADRLAEFRRLLAKVLLLPGFEFTATFGFHILAIFPETTSIRLMEHLLLALGVAEDRFGSGEVGATSDVLRAYEVLAEHGALVIGAHVNSAHGIAMQGMRFGGQTKIAYTQDPNLHALEVTDLGSTSRRSTAAFFSGVKAEYARRMHCIQGSDAHRLDRDPNRDTNLGVGDRPTDVLLPSVSFAALKNLFAGTDFDRVRAARPGGPAADALHEARDTGNTASQAFHERVTAARTGSSLVVRDVVAFVNGNGGTVYVGVGTADRRLVPGVPESAKVIEALRADIAAQIMPAIAVEVDVIDYGGKSVLALRVPEGSDKPYALDPGTILVRRGAESAVASRDEIVAMVRSAATAPAPALAEATAPVSPPEPPPPVPASPPAENGRHGQGEADIATMPTDPISAAFDVNGIAPRTGVEIVDAREQDGVTYYAMRDLRNGSITPDVTRDTTRRLWKYAIGQREAKEVDEGHIRWMGDFGFWKIYRPNRGERRYNLAHRSPGAFRIFYGVTEDGLDDRWRAVIPSPRTTA